MKEKTKKLLLWGGLIVLGGWCSRAIVNIITELLSSDIDLLYVGIDSFFFLVGLFVFIKIWKRLFPNYERKKPK